MMVGICGYGSSPQARGTQDASNAPARGQRFIPAGAGNTMQHVQPWHWPAVHPRRRGEHGRNGALPAVHRRFIPAGAGNTGTHERRGALHTVHPRRRGEHTLVYNSQNRVTGSSPQARGTLLDSNQKTEQMRFIPAGAGNTTCGSGVWATPSVHPRRRGEHCGRQSLAQRACGSSPQARGTQLSARRQLLPGRFIPAGAGNTPVDMVRDVGDAVHPRRRGEHQFLCTSRNDGHGSSPQARGTRMKEATEWHRIAFIPAGAGNTDIGQLGIGEHAVHPRRRGEHIARLSDARRPRGSSPQARGTLAVLADHGRHVRFIPAGAGNTRPSSPALNGWPVHPRRRGEHMKPRLPTRTKGGSSPQARGTHLTQPID